MDLMHFILNLCLCFHDRLLIAFRMNWLLLFYFHVLPLLLKASFLEPSQLRPFLSFFKHKIDMHELIWVQSSTIAQINLILLYPTEALIDEVSVQLYPKHVIDFPIEQVLDYQQKLVTEYNVLLLRSHTQDVALDCLPSVAHLEGTLLSATHLQTDSGCCLIPSFHVQSGWVVYDDLQQLELQLVDAMKIVKVVHEILEKQVHVFVQFPLWLIQSHPQCPIDEEYGLADILHAHQPVSIDVAGQQQCAANATILTVYINSCISGLREAVDGIDGENELIEGRIGVHGEAEVLYFTLLCNPLELSLHLGLVPILTHIPDLKLMVADMRLEEGDAFGFWEGGVIDLGEYLCDFVVAQHLLLQFVVVVCDVLLERLHCLVFLQLAQHSHQRSKHLLILLCATNQIQTLQPKEYRKDIRYLKMEHNHTQMAN